MRHSRDLEGFFCLIVILLVMRAALGALLLGCSSTKPVTVGTLRAARAAQDPPVWEGPELAPTTRSSRPPPQVAKGVYITPAAAVGDEGIPLGIAKFRGHGGAGPGGFAEALLWSPKGSGPVVGRSWTFTVGPMLASMKQDSRRYVQGLVVTAARLPSNVDLAVIGAPGNVMMLDPGTGITLGLPLEEGTGGAGIVHTERSGSLIAITIDVPLQASWIGQPLWMQSYAIVPGANGLGLVTGNALQARFGGG